MRLVRLLLASALASPLALIECGSDTSCDADASACTDASVVPGVSGGGCDSSKPASQGGCAVDDTDGYFVSPAGNDANDGSKATPFETIGKGILASAGNAQRPNVYVCAGSYAENLVIQNAPAGVALHGGFDCASWAQVNASTVVAPAWQTGNTSQYVLHVLGAAAVVESMTLTAPDTTDPGASSIAAYVDGSEGMTFRRATVTAGVGADAAQGTQQAAAAPNTSGAAAQNGNGVTTTCSCTSDTTIGGAGFSQQSDAGGPTAGEPVIPSDPDAGQPGTLTGICAGGTGANGLPSTSNGASTATLGGITSSGWVSSNGGPGGVGGTAQGGGGAYWSIASGLPGGGGGCGGCGGSGGAGGAGGGASIAIGALTSTLRIQSSTVRAGKAGNGANGVAGQPGQPGGAGGNGGACNGGNGGTGGQGGAGGGGAGGVSVGIAFTPNNATPDVDAQSTVLAGTAGSGGHDATAQMNQAIDGLAAPIHGF